MQSLNVIVIGPSIQKSKGGMATVIHNLISYRNGVKRINYKHIVSHVEGSAISKIIIFCKAVLKLTLEKEIDIIHIHVASDTSIFRKSLFILLGQLIKKPVIIHVHGADFDSFYFKSNILIKRYIKYIFSLGSKVLVLSNYWKAFFEQNLPQSDVQVLYNGVDTTALLSSCSNRNNPDNFLFLGRLCQRKGIYDLLKAVNILVNQQNQRNLMFYLAGDGVLKEVQDIIKKYHLEKNTSILGWLDEKKKGEVLSRVDTVLLPSYSEALPMALIEAMANGKVIISCNVGGIPDLVGDGNGFLLEPGDIVGLCNYINYTRMNPKLTYQISLNNKNKIKEQFDLSVISEQLCKLYYELAGKVNGNSELVLDEEPAVAGNYVSVL